MASSGSATKVYLCPEKEWDLAKVGQAVHHHLLRHGDSRWREGDVAMVGEGEEGVVVVL